MQAIVRSLAALGVAAICLSPAVSLAAVSVGGVLAHSPDDITGFSSLTGNDNLASIVLPFTFTIEGVGYTQIALSTNGWIEFGGNTSGDSDPGNDCLPTGAHTNPFLAAYWDDLNPFGSAVRYGTVGSSGNRVFIADYEVDLTSGSEGSDDLRFQIQLHEGSNVITVRFRDQQSQTNGIGATLGFQGAGGASASTVQPLGCNAKIMDDNRPNEGWSADVGRAGQVTLAAVMQHSPDDITGFPTLSGNDATATATMPFSVTIEGTSYNTVAISTNGWLEFGGNTSGNSDPTNDCLPTPAHTNPFLAAYWDDMETFGTGVRYGTVGTSPNRVFVVDFVFENVAGPEGSDDTAMQVQVHERSGLINVRYRDKQSNAVGVLATIGFQGAGGASATSYPLTCNGRVLDDNDVSYEGWSVHGKSGGAMSLHSVLVSSSDDITGFSTLSGDNVTADVTLPFTVTLDGGSFSTLTISSNGWIEFGGNTSGETDPTNDCLPTAAHTNPFLAAYWDDMSTASTNIRYGTVGTSPNRTFVADFYLLTTTGGDDSGNDDVQVQVMVHEGSNTISVKYPFAQHVANGQAATIGYQGAGGSLATASGLTCNGKVLDDNFPNTGWSVAPLPVCGNGYTETREGCDQASGNGTTASCCSSSCQLKSSGTTCRASAGVCDVVDTCSGASDVCPVVSNGANLAQGQAATQSSNFDGTGLAGKAVDGSTDGVYANGSVTHTNFDLEAWWQVDLGSVQEIGAIQLYPRTDCCTDRTSNLYVFVSDTAFSSTAVAATLAQSGVGSFLVAGTLGSPTTVDVNRTGRYVRVQLRRANNLSLAEVRVLAGIDARQSSLTPCRGSAGICDVVENCTGSTDDCPADGFASSSTPCRAVAGLCDAAENCTGSGPLCPQDAPVAGGTPCEDGSFCNGTETCDGFSCTDSTGDPCTGPDGDGDCTETCDEDANDCQGADPDATACTDGLFCTGTESCSGGVCTASTGDPCTGADGDGNCLESCDEGGDDCDAPDPDGSACTDGQFCTGTETCTAGACANSTGDPCPGPDNDDDCTETCDESADMCSGDDGDGAACNDGSFCNGTETCGSGTCGASTGDPCAGPDGDEDCTETCDEGADDCEGDDLDESACTDGLYCTGTESCTAGVCGNSTGDPCPGADGDGDCAETCDEDADDCLAPDAVGEGCDDSLFCTAIDTCDGAGACTGAGDPCAAGGDCADVCNETDDHCNEPAATACDDDGNPCTQDQCTGDGVCAHPANTVACDDGDADTCNDTCSSGVCAGFTDPALCIDHFKCYKAGDAGDFPGVASIDVEDEFETGKSFRLKKPTMFCSPVDKNGEGLVDGTAYLACYGSSYAKTDPPQVKFLTEDRRSDNQFGPLQEFGYELITAGGPRTLCLPTTKDGAPSALELDAFKCHKAATRKGSPKFTKPSTLTLIDTFATTSGYLSKPAMLCNPASVGGSPIAEPVPKLECYKAREAPLTPFDTVDVETVLGPGTLEVGKLKVICVPSRTQE